MENNVPYDAVIHAYTDDEALEDGVLVAVNLGQITRVTRAVFDWLCPEEDISELARACQYMTAIVPDRGWYTGEFQGRALWVIPNELDTLTLMFPEDY